MKKINRFVGFIVCVFIVVAVCMIFAPTVKVLDNVYTGYDIAFGYTETKSIGILGMKIEHAVDIFLFSWQIVLSYGLLILGFVLSFISIFCKSKVLNFLVAACCLAAGVLFIFTPQFVVISEDLKKLNDTFNSDNKLSQYVDIEYGIIVTIVLSFVSVFVSLGYKAGILG